MSGALQTPISFLAASECEDDVIQSGLNPTETSRQEQYELCSGSLNPFSTVWGSRDLQAERVQARRCPCVSSIVMQNQPNRDGSDQENKLHVPAVSVISADTDRSMWSWYCSGGRSGPEDGSCCEGLRWHHLLGHVIRMENRTNSRCDSSPLKQSALDPSTDSHSATLEQIEELTPLHITLFTPLLFSSSCWYFAD